MSVVISLFREGQAVPGNKAEITVGSDHIIIARRYRALGALNDLFIAVWFLTGSILFFFDSLMTGGTWLFVVGSLQLLLRPAITLAELVHVKRIDQHPQKPQ
ncbi:YrhK family protein [Pantoea stewartii]|uniref:YrhK family protein n=1 Tax=Pantoea stewartii TaxID=66269 RepID=UPI0021D4AAC9|nr:YrhK family protein [Pantoea stewartii]MCU7368773.1 YrhK family protein [Pantoea stewartii]